MPLHDPTALTLLEMTVMQKKQGRCVQRPCEFFDI